MLRTDKKPYTNQRSSITTILVKSLLLLLLLLVLSGSTSAMSETPSAAQDSDRLLLQDASAAERDAGTVHQLDMSSGAASISLGPVVVNEDGTHTHTLSIVHHADSTAY